MSIKRIWCRCDCGRLHAVGFVSQTTVCTCGRRLYERAFDPRAVQDVPATTEED